MQEKVEITIREAIPKDASELLKVYSQVGKETPFLILDENGANFTEEGLAKNLEQLYASINNTLFVALADKKIVGTANIKASYMKRIEHIGEIGISILKDYWGLGLGTLMMEDLILWAQESCVIRRLELTVQARNIRALELYRKLGFSEEALMPRGAKTDDGEFLDVYLMSLMID